MSNHFSWYKIFNFGNPWVFLVLSPHFNSFESWFFVCFCFPEIGSLYVALAILEFKAYFKIPLKRCLHFIVFILKENQSLNLDWFSQCCLSFPGVVILGECHYDHFDGARLYHSDWLQPGSISIYHCTRLAVFKNGFLMI